MLLKSKSSYDGEKDFCASPTAAITTSLHCGLWLKISEIWDGCNDDNESKLLNIPCTSADKALGGAVGVV